MEERGRVGGSPHRWERKEVEARELSQAVPDEFKTAW
jgi:hypothetical protein